MTRRDFLSGRASAGDPGSHAFPRAGLEPADLASAVVHAAPGRRDDVRARLQAMPGVEIHAETPDGRFIVTAEDTLQTTAGDTMIRLHGLEGVVNAAMVYQYSESAKECP